MTTNRELDEILAEMGRAHRAMDAPKGLERTLRCAAQSRSEADRQSRPRWAWAVAALLLAALATSGAIWQMRRGGRPQDHEARRAPAAQAGPGATHSVATDAARGQVAAAAAPARRAGAGHVRREVSANPSAGSQLDEFVPLPVSEGLPPAAELSVVRVTLQGSDLQQYGLEAPADAVAKTMLAEFVVGEDGLPRAIRIVR